MGWSRVVIILGIAATLLTACGGGGSGSAPPPQQNAAPLPAASSQPTGSPPSAPPMGPTLTPTPTPGPASNGSSVPTWQGSFTYGGTAYTYTMVGANPMLHTTTTIPAVIVPLKLVFSDGTAFDATPLVAPLLNSPIFTSALFAAGTTQYGDAQMRSEFWGVAANSNYHVLLGVPQVMSTVTVNVPSADGFVVTESNGSKQGEVTFDWFMNTTQVQLLQEFGISPTSVTFFSTADTLVLEPGSTTSSYNGYHNSYNLTTSGGSGTFGTIWGAMFSTNPQDVTHVGHEVAEWLNDPLYPSKYNVVPAWEVPGTNVCDGNQLEVGDPVATRLFTIDGYTFEDAVFLEWFSRQSPSSAINGQYDLTNSLSSPSSACQ